MYLQGPRHGRSGLGGERGKMRRGLPGHSHWCTWGNCLLPGRFKGASVAPDIHAILRLLHAEIASLLAIECIRTTSSRCWRDREIRNCWHKWQVPCQWVISRTTFWTSSGVASQHCRSPMVASGGSCGRRLEEDCTLSKTHCPPKQGVSAWPTFYRLSQMLTSVCLSMGCV